jgi:hypothetical protein
MDIRSIKEQAFKAIQEDPVLWKQWNEVRWQEDRYNMLFEMVYDIAWDECKALYGVGAESGVE